MIFQEVQLKRLYFFYGIKFDLCTISLNPNYYEREITIQV